jgi:peptide/nickel transport system substrate-binding protein
VRLRDPWERARRSAASLVLITGVLAVACAPAAPVSPAATVAPAKPAAAAASPGASPAASPVASPGAAVAPATAAGAVAKVQPKGSLTMVIESDGDTIHPKDGTTDNAMFVMGNVYDGLTGRDWSAGTPKIVGKLAESFEQSQADPKTWRFKLRPGLKFINGEPINADAVVNMVTFVTDPANPGLAIDEFGLSGAKATRIDEYIVDITTKEADAIFPSRVVRMGIPAPKWLASMPNDNSITQAVGSGPYKLTEFVKGDHFLLQANEDYWGPNKPRIAEIKIVFRNEAAVRGAMLQAGEVQLATLLTPEQAKQMPASLIELTGEAVGIKINPEHPVLKDLRVRQAINMSLDRKSMIDSLYGDVAEPLNGMMVRKSSLGWNPNLKEYPYDPAKAKQLVQEAGAVGQSIELISRNGVVPRVDEVTELFANQVSQTGLKVTVKSLEVGQWRTANRQVKPGETRTDLLLTSASDPVLDSSRTLTNYYKCGGVNAQWCDQEWTAKFNNVLGLSGDARAKGFQDLWQVAYDQNVFTPLFGLNFIHGISPKLHWGTTKRYDLIRDFTEWTLDD